LTRADEILNAALEDPEEAMENTALCEVHLYLTQWDHARTNATEDSSKLLFSGSEKDAREMFDKLTGEIGAGYIPLRSKFDVSLELMSGGESIDHIDLLSTLFYAEAEGFYNHTLKTIAGFLEQQ
jgi:hypothetical protein